MSSFAVLLLCIQACLVQNVFGSCVGYGAGTGSGLGLGTGLGLNAGLGLGLAPAAFGAGALNANYGLRSPAATIASPGLDYGDAIGSAYGGAGEGNVAVAGELPVAGNTAVTGQVPFIGVVNFGGVVPAAGAVTISGKCACGCDY